MKIFKFFKLLWWDTYKKGFWFEAGYFFITNLPCESGAFLRACFLRYFFKSTGSYLRINTGNVFFHPEEITLGNNFLMSVGCVIEAAAGAGLVIGHDVSIGPGVKIWTINHETKAKHQLINQQGWLQTAPISIGNDVWIGANVIILPEVRIPEGCVIGAGAIVTKNVKLKAYGVYAGNPVRLIRERT